MYRFRPGVPATLSSLSPGLLTIFIDIERLLIGTSTYPCPELRANAVFAMIKKPAGTYWQDKTVPDSKFRYERMPQEYEEMRGPAFPEERILRNEKPLYVYFRTHLLPFLEELRSSGSCQVVAFTSMVKERADAILDCIEEVGQGKERKQLFQGRLYRENCCWVPKQSGSGAARLLQPDLVAAAAGGRTRMAYVKDITVATPLIDPKRCIIIDTNAANCAGNLRNSICVEEMKLAYDSILVELKNRLLQYSTYEDVRDVCMSGQFYLSWTAYKDQRPSGAPELSAEEDGTQWILKQPVHYEPEEVPIKKPTRRRVCFAEDSGMSMSGCGLSHSSLYTLDLW